MNAQWMLYALLVGAALTLAALAAEQGARLGRRATRWGWALAMALTVCLPLLAQGDGERATAPPAAVGISDGAAGVPAGLSPSLAAGGLPVIASLTPRTWPTVAPWWPADLERLLGIAWAAASLLLAGALAAASVALHRRRRHWLPAVVNGTPVLVSVDAGPAVVGVLRPVIVLPAWLAAAPPPHLSDLSDLSRSSHSAHAAHSYHLSLVLAHERSHIDAGDQRLLAASWLLLVAMPWNLPLWYQLRRLRRAIEVDCDARVLARGAPVADYGAALIAVASHAPALWPLAPAMAASSHFLTRRIRLMTRSQSGWQRLAAPLLLLLSLDIGIAAARITPPAAPRPAANAASALLITDAASVPQAARHALAGYYQLGANRVAIVSATADGLFVKTNLEPGWRLLPESQDRYFLPGTDLKVAFDRAAGSMTLIQLGAAGDPAPRTDAAAVERADAWIKARVASQAALPGGAAIVRNNIAARTVTDLHAGDFTPGLLRLASAQMPRQRARNERLGAVREIRFDGVNRWGWDRYTVRHANGTAHWVIWLDADGRLANATVEDPPR